MATKKSTYQGVRSSLEQSHELKILLKRSCTPRYRSEATVCLVSFGRAHACGC
jgi:hypothetical protein